MSSKLSSHDREQPSQPNRVLLLAPVPIDDQMLGPGLRYWEFARVLSQDHPVTLLTPNDNPAQSGAFTVRCYREAAALESAVVNHDVVVLQGFSLMSWHGLRNLLKTHERYLAVDIYTPLNLEGLELRPDTSQAAVEGNLIDLSVLLEQLKMGDFFFCAGERQRLYYLGMLAAVGRINPHTYLGDRTGRHLIDIVPFGLLPEPPRHDRSVLKGVHPKVHPDDEVLLWFGGMWNWLDPASVVRAFAEVSPNHPKARLVFVTRKPHDLDRPEAAMFRQCVALSQSLGLDDEILFCNTIPFRERGNLLLEADFGLSYHPDHLETQFAFRSRLLDYIWASLPMIVARGDELSALVDKHGLGYVVPPGDVSALRDVMFAALSESTPRASRRERFDRVRSELTWEHVIEPLANFCRQPWHAADKGIAFYERLQSSEFERILTENENNKHELRRVQAEFTALNAAFDEMVSYKDSIIRGYADGRVMRLMLGVQSRLNRLKRPKGSN